mmetsp:Transcript_21968/g.50285  ORF Transcript_21968/g.50285 Transcript_21968/m.50285 type:complete len:130 (+) Transcript_21968:42-431(+)
MIGYFKACRKYFSSGYFNVENWMNPPTSPIKANARVLGTPRQNIMAKILRSNARNAKPFEGGEPRHECLASPTLLGMVAASPTKFMAGPSTDDAVQTPLSRSFDAEAKVFVCTTLFLASFATSSILPPA